MQAKPDAAKCAGCGHHEAGCAYCSLWGRRRRGKDAACRQRTAGGAEKRKEAGGMAAVFQAMRLVDRAEKEEAQK